MHLAFGSSCLGGSICLGYHEQHWKVKRSVCCLAVLDGGRGYFLPYIFLYVDCFEWALIGHIEKCRVHSVLWQFWMGGGGIYPSLYILICWLFRMGSHWSHWKVPSSPCALAVSNGGRGYCLPAVRPPSPLLDGTLLSLLFFSSMILGFIIITSRKLKLLKWLFSNAVNVMLLISDAEYYVPLKLLKQ